MESTTVETIPQWSQLFPVGQILPLGEIDILIKSLTHIPSEDEDKPSIGRMDLEIGKKTPVQQNALMETLELPSLINAGPYQAALADVVLKVRYEVRLQNHEQLKLDIR